MAMKKDEERVETSIKALSTLLPQVTPTKLNKSSEKIVKASEEANGEKKGEEKKDEKEGEKEGEKGAEEANGDEMEFDENFELDPELEKALNQIEDLEAEKPQEPHEEAVALPDETKQTKLEEIAIAAEEEDDEGAGEEVEDKMDIDTENKD